MGEGMISDVMTLGHNSLDQVRIGCCALTNNEKARLDPFVLQNIEYLRSPIGIGAIVKCQRELTGYVAPTLDNVGSRNARVVLVDDLPGIGVELKAAFTLFRCLSHLQKLAFALKVNVLASPNVA